MILKNFFEKCHVERWTPQLGISKKYGTQLKLDNARKNITTNSNDYISRDIIRKWTNQNLRELYFFYKTAHGYVHELKLHEEQIPPTGTPIHEAHKIWTYQIARKKVIPSGTINAALIAVLNEINALSFSNPDDYIQYKNLTNHLISVKKSASKVNLRTTFNGINQKFNEKYRVEIDNGDGTFSTSRLKMKDCIELDKQIFQVHKELAYRNSPQFKDLKARLKVLESIANSLEQSGENVTKLKTALTNLKTVISSIKVEYNRNPQKWSSSRASDWSEIRTSSETHHPIYPNNHLKMQIHDNPTKWYGKHRYIFMSAMRTFSSQPKFQPAIKDHLSLNMDISDRVRFLIGKLIDGTPLTPDEECLKQELAKKLRSQFTKDPSSIDFGEHTTNQIFDYQKNEGKVVFIYSRKLRFLKSNQNFLFKRPSLIIPAQKCVRPVPNKKATVIKALEDR